MNKTSLMKNKKGLVMGVANERSIAWAIAKELFNAGAEIALTYQGDALKKRVYPLAKEINSSLILECNVEKEDNIVKTFKKIKNKWNNLDFVLHAIAFSDREELKGRYIDTSKENFKKTLNISCFSFTSISKEASKIMEKGGSLLTIVLMCE